MSELGVLIAEGHEALRRGDGARARDIFSEASEQAVTGEVLQGLADAEYLDHRYEEAIDLLERAYAAYREEGDTLGAVQAARELGWYHGSMRGDHAVMQGWVKRAQTLLGEAGASSEEGWVELNLGMFEGDDAERERHFRKAVEVARRHGDADLNFIALSYLGSALVASDRVEEGMLLLDEAMAAVAGDEIVHFYAFSEIFCQVMTACEQSCDIVRADQWIEVGATIARRRNLPVVTAFCRTHYGGLLISAGRWDEAEQALSEATRIWGTAFRYMRGTSLLRLADLRARQGRFEEAERLLEGFEGAVEAARPLAMIQVARGERARAVETLERAIGEVGQDRNAAAPLLGLLVDVALAVGDLERAASASASLAVIASRSTGPYLGALAALARGRVCLAQGEGDPLHCLREAMSGFTKAQLPVELARARLELASAITESSPEVALAEAQAALESFERLKAAREADAAAAIVRALGGKSRTGPKGAQTPEGLTKREAEVLELLGTGLSNVEISERLYISRKTVEHHVSSVLAKLGLRSRAEAAAYVTRRSGQR